MPDRTGVQRGATAVSATESDVAHRAAGGSSSRSRGFAGLSNWPLRAKLIAVFAVPTVAALFLAGLRIMDGFAATEVYERAAKRIELSEQVASLVHEVQGERTAMSAWIVEGRPGDRRVLNSAIDATQHAAEQLRGAAGLVEQIDDPATTKRYKQAIARLDSLDQLRASARDPDFPASAVVVSYGVVIDTLLGVSDQFGAEVTDKGLQERHEALSTLAHAKEYSAQQNVYLLNAAIRGQFKPAELEGIVRAKSNLVSAIAVFNEVASADHRRLYQSAVSGEAVSTRFQLQALALQRARSDQSVGVDAADVTTSSTTTLQQIGGVQTKLHADTAAYTDDLLAQVRQELLITAIVLVAALLIALTLMFIVARSLLRPLRTLRTNALQVAERHLPEAVERIMHESDPREAAERAIDPVPVHTEEEVGQVARAFDVVHGQAVRLAAEQSLLRENVNGIFVNLSRRSQRLVERQLGVIDRLESDEQDPDQLASLFELDHLATRLRRNGESLLVLSGAGLAKSLPRPVPAADVLGAAVSEIEQYSRVEVGVVPQVAVRGMSVHDLVHLLAELFDNATYFSEPETKITVRAVVTRRNALAIQITDRGVGMGDEQIAEANERLADPPDLDVSVTRRMGLYVVARLAQRHGIEVRLRENEDIDGGVIARVVVPQTLLEDVSTADSSLTPPPENLPASLPAGSDGAQASDAFAALPAYTAQQYPGADLEPSNAAALQAEPAWPQEEDGTHNGAHDDSGSSRHVPALPGADSSDENGLTPLDEPISLDDMIAGTSAAGPFVDPDDVGPEDAGPVNGTDSDPYAVEPRPPLPTRQPGTGRAVPGAGQPSTGESDAYRLAVPRGQPQYVPVAQDDAGGVGDSGEAQGAAALEDDVPTRRLPIYQSVLSRWFSEEQPPETGDHAAAPEESHDQPQGDAVADDWSTASDAGWQAVESLWHTGEEETTTAGLPKRVPNAYLVPGSATSAQESGPPGFADTTSARPGQGAISRSADAARTRMMNFQRGYTKGRHALADGGDTQTVGANISGENPTENGMRE